MACHGYYLNDVYEGNNIYNAKLLVNDNNPGIDDKLKSWYAIPQYIFACKNKDGDFITYNGTFKSTKCQGVHDSTSIYPFKCTTCSRIPQRRSFKLRLETRLKKTAQDGTRKIHCIRNEYLTPSEMLAKLNAQTAALDKHKSEIFFLRSQKVQMKIRLRSVREKLSEYSRRGRIKAVCQQLQVASDSGLLNDKSVLQVYMLSSVARNLNVEKNGKRFPVSQRLFYEVVLI